MESTDLAAAQEKPSSAHKPGKKLPGLDRRTILQAAWKIVDTKSVDALTIRALAAELHVQGPALYWHIKSKEELLSLMVEQLLVDTVPTPQPGQRWQDWLFEVHMNHRNAFVQYRNSGLLSAIATPTDSVKTALNDLIVETLMANGVGQQRAQALVAAVASYTLGWVIYEQKENARHITQLLEEREATFEKGLRVIIAGFDPINFP